MKFTIEISEKTLEDVFMKGFHDRRDNIPFDLNPVKILIKSYFKNYPEFLPILNELEEAWNQGWFDAHNVETVHIETGDSNV